MKSRKNRSLKNKSKKNRSKKIWFMKGCYKKHVLGKKCSVCGSYKKKSMQKGQQKGGNCGCGNIPLQTGGNNGIKPFYNPPGPIPGPFTGQPWTASDWPGQDGVGSNNNHYKMNLYHKDPQTMMIVGGKSKNKYNKKSKKRRGGGLIPDSIMNLGRSFSYNMGSSFNALNGYPAPVNPLPYKDQLPNSRSIII